MKGEHEFEDDFPEAEALHEHYSFVAAKGQDPLRVDLFLMNFIEHATRSKIQAAAKNGNIWVNEKPVKQNYKVKPFDSVKVLFEHPPYEHLLVPEDLALEIVYEDEQVVVVNKPAGMVVHPGHGNYSGTLLNALLFHFKDLPLNADNRPGLVHRIDKDTSGLLVVAKTASALVHLTRQFFEKTSKREYVAMVWGTFDEDRGTIEGSIGRSFKNRLQMDVFEDGSHGKPAVTHFEVLESLRYVSVVKCVLETGRTHQIRAHMKHIGHPLFNDERYGGNQILKGTTFSKYQQFVQNCFKLLPRQALHARTLGFEHPVSGKFLTFESEIPNDLQACIEKWRAYTTQQ